MEDRELKKLLLETCPVRPGQEDRAWVQLREQLYAKPARSAWGWIFYPTWRGALVAVLALVLIPVGADLAFMGRSMALATADSQSPGVYATSFYSKSAQAQVVWLNGMEPASDRPTYLDPTSAVPSAVPAPSSSPNGDPNSL